MRFLAIRTPHGVDRDWWIPRESDGSDPRGTDVPLSDLSFDYDMAILRPLMDWRHKITVLDGLDTQCVKVGTRSGLYTNHGHNEQGTMLTGAQAPSNREGNFDGHPSLDFVLHARLGAPALLTACVEPTGTWKCMSYDDAGRFRTPQADPRALFRTAFPEGFVPPDPMEPAVDYSSGERRIFGYDQRALEALQGRLGEVEADKLQRHLAAMGALTPAAGSGTGGGFVGACETSGTDVPEVSQNVGDHTGVGRVTRAQAEVIARAFACGRARCATLQILNDYPNYYTDIPEVRSSGAPELFGAAYRFHEDLVHSYWGASGPELDTIRRGYLAGLRWATGNFALVLEVLDSIVDPLDPNGGTVLDNTIVFWHNEFGHDGHDNQHTRHPAILAGGGGRTLKLGRYLRLRDIAGTERVPHNKLLVSIAHAMGQTDIDFFGDRDLRDRPEFRGPLEPLMV
tara:strand:- start:336 stop:1700 length:1365 start_codon:yes stop_codon:yes gene_type:complete